MGSTVKEARELIARDLVSHEEGISWVDYVSESWLSKMSQISRNGSRSS
jgi:hypothetical protein